MKKIIIFINSQEYIRNYIDSNAFSTLENKYEISFVLKNSILDDVSQKYNLNSKYSYSIDEAVNRKYITASIVMMRRNISKSTSFNFRYKFRTFLTITIGIKEFGFFKGTLNYFKSKLFNLKVYVLSFSPIANIYFSNLAKLPIEASIQRVLKEINPEMVLYPTSAFESDAVEILRACKALKVKTFFLVDNWDNLSSKSILWIKPDFIGVWGQQSYNHAMSIQSFRSDQIFILGTPRVARYFLERFNPAKSHFDFPYVLFIGTLLNFDEISVVNILAKEIESNTKLYRDLKIVYRPHPWGQLYNKALKLKIQSERVVIDPQILINFNKENKSDKLFIPELDYYPSLIGNAKFIVGGLSSMLMESILGGKNYIALVHEEKLNPTSPRKIYENYVHFKELKQLSSVTLCENLELLLNFFRNQYVNKAEHNYEAIDLERDFFLHCDDTPYSDGLAMAIENILD